MTKTSNIAIVLFFALIAIGVWAFYKSSQYGGSFSSYWNSKSSDCKVILPPNLWIVYSEKDGTYAVKKEYFGSSVFLWQHSSGLISWSYWGFTNFKDSCKAKSFALQYLRDESERNDKANNYK